MPLLCQLTKDEPEPRQEQRAQIEEEKNSTAFLEQLEARRQRILEVARQTVREMQHP